MKLRNRGQASSGGGQVVDLSARAIARDVGDAAVVLTNVSRTFGEGETAVHALIGASVRVEPGQFVAVMGTSGSGKSTLLTIAGGLEKPDSGTVHVAGVDISTLGPNEMAKVRRRSIGYVFQELNLLSSLTATENVAMPLELDGVGRKAAQAKAVEQLKRMDLGHRLDHFPEDLSGGEQQRVAIARALVTGAGLILADEPTGALDSANGRSVMETLRRACNEGAAAIVVTHDAQLARWADRVVNISDGQVVSEGQGLAEGARDE